MTVKRQMSSRPWLAAVTAWAIGIVVNRSCETVGEGDGRRFPL